MGRRRALRILLSHTAELTRHPVQHQSFVDAAKEAVTRDGHVVVEMGTFPTRHEMSAAVCREEVARADVLVIVAGFHYGSPVRDEPDKSYVELEFETAVERGIPRLVFLLDENTEGPGWLFLPREHGDLQLAFRARLRNTGVVATVRTPDGLNAAMLHAIVALRERGSDGESDPQPPTPHLDADDTFAATYRSFVATAFDRFEFFGVDPRGTPRWHHFKTGYVEPTVAAADHPVGSGPASPGDRAGRALGTVRWGMVRGAAGSGKSTLLRWLGWQAAVTEPAEVPATIPFLVELGGYGGAPPNLDQFVDSLLRTEMPEGWVQRMLDAGRVLLLLDGLDEVPAAAQRGVVQWLENYLNRYPRIRCVLSTRPSVRVEQPLVDARFERFDLLEMSRYNIEQFVLGWHRVARADLSAHWPSDHESRQWLVRSEEDLLRILHERPALVVMSAYPLLCGLLCALNQANRHIPESRKDIYDAALKLLMVQWPNQRRGRSAEGRHAASVPSPPAAPLMGADATGIQLTFEQQMRLLQQLAYWMVKNGKDELPHEVAQRRIESAMRGLDGAESEQVRRVVQYLSLECGVLRELPKDQSLQFLHRTFRDHLAAKEIFDGDNIDQMLNNAHLLDWHDVVVMAGAHARPPELRQLLTRLVDGAVGEHRETFFLLAWAILEQAALLPGDKLTERGRLELAVDELIPPRSTSAADRLASVGPLVLDFLGTPDRYAEEHRVLLVRTLAGIAAEGKLDAVPQVERFLRQARRPEAKRIVEQLLIVWGRRGGDYEAYAQDVLGELPFDGIRMSLQNPHRVAHLHHLKNVTDLILRDATGSLTPVAAMPRLRRLMLLRNEQVDLTQLTGTRSLRTLELDGCSAMVSARPIDLSPVASLPLRRLKISGMATKVDLAGLDGARLRSLLLSGGVLLDDVALPAGLQVQHLVALTRGRGRFNFTHLSGLRSLIIDRPLADDEHAALHEWRCRLVVLPH